MGKDTEEVKDDKTDDKVIDESILGAEENTIIESQEDEIPKDIRGAIRHAIKETFEDQEEISDTYKKRSQKNNESVDGQKKSTKDSSADISGKNEKDKKDVEEKLDAPPFYKQKGKSTWDKLSSEDKKVILSREKEVSDGFVQYSSKLKSLEDLERVIAPRLPAIQQFGVPPAQVVDRLFQWMEQLTHPNSKVETFKMLARNFGVDLNQVVPRQKSQPLAESEVEPEEIDQNDPPQWARDFVQTVSSELNGVKQTVSSQQQAAADSFVMNWAKDKPHFSKVRQLMGQLSAPGPNGEPGAVPLKNGQVDLDGAYEAAIKIHPEVAAQIQLENQEKAENEQREKTNREAAERAAKLAKAKKAGASIRPAAPALGTNVASKANGKSGNTPISVRDALRQSIRELNDNN